MACLSDYINAENIYSPEQAELLLPVAVVPDVGNFQATFSLTNPKTYEFRLKEAKETNQISRTTALYNSETMTLSVPEVNVDGQLYDVSFSIVENCSPFCIKLNTADDIGTSGANIFTNRIATGNSFSCSSCHSIKEDQQTGKAMDGFKRPGHPLHNVTKRSTYKNGQLNSMLDAVNTCLTEWMNAERWTEDSTDWKNLFNWLDDQADTETADPVVYQIAAPPATLSGGDALEGQITFNGSCAICHGENAQGSGLAPSLVNVSLDSNYIATRVRSSGLSNSATYQGLTGGIMPFWSPDRLSDNELVNVIAYLTTAGQGILETNGGETNDNNASSCSNDHPNVGKTATLSTKSHAVSGTAEIVDNCTIKLSNFNFDGGGIDVQVYLGNDNQFLPRNGGFSTSGDLVGTRYENADLTLTLPEGKTLDDFNSISIWCVDVGVSFGDGIF